MLCAHEKLIAERCAQSKDLNGFLVELKDIADRSLRAAPAPPFLPPVAYYQQLIHDLEADVLRPESGSRRARARGRLVSIDSAMRVLAIAVTDPSGREHTLTLTLPLDYPQSMPAVRTDLPVPFDPASADPPSAAAAELPFSPPPSASQPSLSQGSSSSAQSSAAPPATAAAATTAPTAASRGSIASVIHRFRAVSLSDSRFFECRSLFLICLCAVLCCAVLCWQVVSSCDEFWNVMDDFDTHTWVLEPDQPLRGATTRRIAIGQPPSAHASFPSFIHSFIHRSHVSHTLQAATPHCTWILTRSARATSVSAVSSGQMRPSIRSNSNSAQIWRAGSLSPPLPPSSSLQMPHCPTHRFLCFVCACVGRWRRDDALTPRENLQRILEVTFPSPKTSKREDFSTECGICYAYRSAHGV